MKLTIVFLGIISSLIFGFLYAGFIGAFLFALILTFTNFIYRKKNGLKFSKIGIAGFFFSFYILGFLLMYLGGLIGADKNINRKLELIKMELKSKGYKTNWVIISQKRLSFFNDLLPNSSKKKTSKHLEGKAIDVYVFDINGDNVFNKQDISIIERVNHIIEKSHPDLIGGLGDYYETHNYFSRHMIHFDTGGKRKRWHK